MLPDMVIVSHLICSNSPGLHSGMPANRSQGLARTPPRIGPAIIQGATNLCKSSGLLTRTTLLGDVDQARIAASIPITVPSPCLQSTGHHVMRQIKMLQDADIVDNIVDACSPQVEN